MSGEKKFYPEIQGLRGVSVIAVILFHLGVEGCLPGSLASIFSLLFQDL